MADLQREDVIIDAFNKLVADGTTNELDIASHYSFSPERLRLFLNSSRQFPNYSSVSKFSDDADVWKLQPGDGDNMHIESAESATYSVQYVMQTSFSFKLNQSLQSGDKIRIGPYNGTDGWFMEHRGDHADDKTVDIIQSRGGTETTLESDKTLSEPVTTFTRIECRYNWYNVGNQIWRQTYTNGGNQFNDKFAETSIDDQRGPESANLNLWYEINQGSGNTGTELVVGSCSAVTLGAVANLTRNKGDYQNLTLSSGNDNTWVPVYAARIDPNKSNVNCQFTELEILQYNANADLEMIVVSVDSSKTDASSFSAPKYHHDYNSVIQTTTSVSQVPKASDGTQTTLTSSDKPGGHTLASAQLLNGGGQTDTASEATEAREVKKSVLSSDVIVFLVRSGTTDGSEFDFAWEISQNW